MHPVSEQTTREYATLNALRGVAAIAVVFFHGTPMFGSIAPGGYLAVDFFFVLSGFVIAHAYGDRLRSRLGRREFVIIRLIRFYPLYIAGFVIGVANELLLLASNNPFALPVCNLVAAVVAGALFIPMPLATREHSLFPVNVPSWSLFFELLVNILYAVVFPWLGSVTLIATILVSAGILITFMPATGIGHVGVTSMTFGTGCARTVLSFAMGILIYQSRLRAPTVPFAPLLVATAASFMIMSGSVAYDLLFVLLISPALIILGAATEPPPVLARHARLLGLASFPLYALHRPVLILTQAVAHRLSVPPSLVGWPILILLIITCCTVALRYDVAARKILSDARRRHLPSDPADVAAP